MEITIDIIDTQNDHVLSLEKAQREKIVLDWKGSDKKELFIVGSSLSFTMVGMSCEDGQYYELFTGDETRFKVIMYTPDVTLWSGFLLPDAYSEPYEDAPTKIDFQAADGLGRLKGKILPDDFYDEEKSVIEIIAKCLELTGLQLDFRFSPAIENYQQKDYNLIYIDTRHFIKKDKKQDAYKILDDLLKSMSCTVYQAENYFNIEGFNVRNFRVYKAKVYTYLGVFSEEVEITRIQKDITPIATPLITMQPPYGTITVEHERVDVNLPETLHSEENDGWASERNLVDFIYASDWYGKNGFYARAANWKNLFTTTSNFQSRREYGVTLGRKTDPNINESISLRNRPYIQKGKKYSLSMEFELLTQYQYSEESKQAFIDSGLWTNPFLLQVKVKDEQFDSWIFLNITDEANGYMRIPQVFGLDKTSETQVEFVATKSGLLDIIISAVNDENNGIQYLQINEMSLETLGFEEIETSEIKLNDEYTVTSDIELVYSDDLHAFSKSFRLAKLRTKNENNLIPVPIIRQQFRDGFWYAMVNLEGANIIKENITEVYNGVNSLEVLEVIYNYKDSQEHAIKLASELTGDLAVKIFNYNAILENRDYWEQWSDSVYKIEKLRYNDATANVHHRLFDSPIPKVDSTLKNNVKFNDIINFLFLGKNPYMLTNCKWYVDTGRTTITAIQNYYAVAAGQNIPPVVEAGNDIIVTGDATTFNLTSEGFDPDGFVVSYLWEELTSSGTIITNPNDNNTGVTGFSGDFATYRVTVTDNEGATGSDIINVYRSRAHAFLTTETVIQDLIQVKERTYQLGFNPNISEGAALNIRGSYKAIAGINDPYNSALAAFRIKINGVYIVNKEPGFGSNEPTTFVEEDSINLNYFNGDIIIFEMYAEANQDDPALSNSIPFASSTFTIDGITFTDGMGEITGVPVTKLIEV